LDEPGLSPTTGAPIDAIAAAAGAFDGDRVQQGPLTLRIDPIPVVTQRFPD
jgi:hypothetical protein